MGGHIALGRTAARTQVHSAQENGAATQEHSFAEAARIALRGENAQDTKVHSTWSPGRIAPLCSVEHTTVQACSVGAYSAQHAGA